METPNFGRLGIGIALVTAVHLPDRTPTQIEQDTVGAEFHQEIIPDPSKPRIDFDTLPNSTVHYGHEDVMVAMGTYYLAN